MTVGRGWRAVALAVLERRSALAALVAAAAVAGVRYYRKRKGGTGEQRSRG